jgi:transposase
MGAGTRPPYPAAFRAEAVQLVRGGGRSLTQAAKDLGVHHDTLRTWVR